MNMWTLTSPPMRMIVMPSAASRTVRTAAAALVRISFPSAPSRARGVPPAARRPWTRRVAGRTGIASSGSAMCGRRSIVRASSTAAKVKSAWHDPTFPLSRRDRHTHAPET